MKSKRLLLVFFSVLMAVIMPACTLRASTPPPATPTLEGLFPVPGTQEMDIFEAIATQTALAVSGGVQPTASTGDTGAQQTPAAPQSQPTSSGSQTTSEQPAATQPAPVVPTAITVPQPTAGIPTSYTLQKGEFPFCIARRFNVNPSELLAINGLGVNTTLQPGYTLKIPQTGNPFPDTRELRDHPTTYRVGSNDTIYSIACYFGDVDPLMIAYANGINSPYTLTSGQTINIP